MDSVLLERGVKSNFLISAQAGVEQNVIITHFAPHPEVVCLTLGSEKYSVNNGEFRTSRRMICLGGWGEKSTFFDFSPQPQAPLDIRITFAYNFLSIQTL